ncbi:acyltransferase family protein [Sneathiella sp. HT1-7]|uniref:acyltransferase family protein n=1 Tax=Sneathiella sp. HT1-7 TaxID=2887192 RepID=UPI001D14C24B|nr:acyltransferase [Sneathiella sp. HT1-7]MCC3306529.1 acyltransferase [Sneathiella sp. HT1-7]
MKSVFLSDVDKGRDNNLNLIRMFAAAGVLVSHAWPISTGSIAEQPLHDILHGIDLGIICVSIFFAISGYLIAQSYIRDPNFKRFWFSRVMRIFPALLVVLLVTALILAPLITVADVKSVWLAAPDYILRNFTLFSLEQYLPGVFKGNPVGGSINIPLWTLSHELVCYFFVTALGIAGLLKTPRLMLIAWLAFIVCYAAIIYFEPQSRLVALAKLAFPFLVGVVLFVWRQKIILHWGIGGGLVILTALLYDSFFFREIFMLSLTYIIFLLAFLPGGKIKNYNRLGDYSYGIYIYAFPIQQLVAYSDITNPFLNIIYALPLTLLCAVLSWTIIEKPSLGIAKQFKLRSRSAIPTK